MPIEIPVKPEGIFNEDNLYNDAYGDLGKLPWNTPDLHARIQWSQSQVPYIITAWYSMTGGFDQSFRGPTMFRAEVSPGVGVDVDTRLLMQRADLVVAMLKSLTLQPGDKIPQGQPYPGFYAVVPAGDNPIGDLWEPAPLPGREVYREAAGVTGYANGDTFETISKRYQRIIVSFAGSGPFGTGGKQTPAWEVVYRR